MDLLQTGSSQKVTLTHSPQLALIFFKIQLIQT